MSYSTENVYLEIGYAEIADSKGQLIKKMKKRDANMSYQNTPFKFLNRELGNLFLDKYGETNNGVFYGLTYEHDGYAAGHIFMPIQ